MSDKMVVANGVEIRTVAFGDPGGEPLLLIMGAGTPGFTGRFRSLWMPTVSLFATTIGTRASLHASPTRNIPSPKISPIGWK